MDSFWTVAMSNGIVENDIDPQLYLDQDFLDRMRALYVNLGSPNVPFPYVHYIPDHIREVASSGGTSAYDSSDSHSDDGTGSHGSTAFSPSTNEGDHNLVLIMGQDGVIQGFRFDHDGSLPGEEFHNRPTGRPFAERALTEPQPKDQSEAESSWLYRYCCAKRRRVS